MRAADPAREVEAETCEDAGGTRRRGMGVDIDQAGLDFGDAVGIAGRLGLDHEAGALEVGGEHEIDQRARAARRLLLDAAHLHRLGDREFAEVRLQLVGDHLEERGLAGAVAPDEADARPLRQRRRSLVEEHARPQAQGDVGDVQHAEACRAGRRLWQGWEAMAATGRIYPAPLSPRRYASRLEIEIAQTQSEAFGRKCRDGQLGIGQISRFAIRLIQRLSKDLELAASRHR